MNQHASCDAHVQEFHHIFGGAPDFIAAAPGRVNLIGEHTDYNDGYVFPVAIDKSVYIVARRREDSRVRLHALDAERKRVDAGQRSRSYKRRNRYEFSLATLGDETEVSAPAWSKYLVGVATLLQNSGRTLRGMDALITGDVPIGAGLSSSAALTVSAALAFLTASGSEMDRKELAALCQRVEHEFVGVKCGIMDQTISLLGRADHGLFLDCRSLEHTHVPLNLGEHVIVICNTKVKRELAASEYNKRRAECEKGVSILKRWLPDISSLRDVDLTDFENYEEALPFLTQKRCRYVLEENARVQKAIAALQDADLPAFGRFMNASHSGLRDDYEVSCNELDVLTNIARSVPGVLGTRMTGAGFGGCTVTLAHQDAVETLHKRVMTEYPQQVGIEPEIYLCTVGDGARVRKVS